MSSTPPENSEKPQLPDKKISESEEEMLSILKDNKEIIESYIGKLKDKLSRINGNIYGKWEWSSKMGSNNAPTLDEMINDILLKFANEILSNIKKDVNENDFDSFADVLLSNVYSLSKEDEKSEKILKTTLKASHKIKLKIKTPKEDKEQQALKTEEKQKFDETKEEENPVFVTILKEPSQPTEQKILTLQSLLETVKKGDKIPNDTIDKLVEATYTMPVYLQTGFTTGLLMLGEICNTLKISLKSKNLDVWEAISDYCHKIFESGEIKRYTYVMPSNSIPSIIISVPDFLKNNKKMFRLFEELSAVASCLSVCGNNEKGVTNKEEAKNAEKQRLRYVPHKLYNSGQNDLAIEYLESGQFSSKDMEILKLKCLLHFAAGHYKKVKEEIKEHIQPPTLKTYYRLNSVYMMSNAFLYKFEYKFNKTMGKTPQKYIDEFIRLWGNGRTLDKVLPTLQKPDKNNAQSKFNSNDLFVWHCFKMYPKIIKRYNKYKSVNNKKNQFCNLDEEKKRNYLECLYYFAAFAYLEKFHTPCKKLKPDEFCKFLSSFPKEYYNETSDLYNAYEALTEAFNKNENLFLRSSRFLRTAPKIGEPSTNGDKEFWFKCLYFIFLTFKIQDRLAINSDRLEGPTIGSYMPLERYRQNIIETNEHKLPLLNAVTMNDPMEGKVLKLPTKDEDKEWLKDPKVYIRALSALKDNLPMWDRYADNGTGVCAMLATSMLYRSNTDIQPRDSSKPYSSKILRLEDSRKMYRVAYLREIDDKVEKIKVTHVGGIKEVEEEEEKKKDYRIDFEHYYEELENLLRKYLLLGEHLLGIQKDEVSSCDKIHELVRYYHNKIRYLFKSSVFESEDEIRLLSFNFSTKENIKLPDRYLHYVYWAHPLKINNILIGPKVKDFMSLVPYLEDSVLETKRSIFMKKIETKNVARSKIEIV